MKYLVTLMRTPEFQASVVAAHVDFLAKLRAQGQLDLAGPFTDQSGGAYLLRAESLAAAQALAWCDPLYLTKSSIVTVYEWDAKA